MEVFALFKPRRAAAPSSTAARARPSTETEDESGGDDGPFFDLEFSLPDDADSYASVSDDDLTACSDADDLFLKCRPPEPEPSPSPSPLSSAARPTPSTKLRVLMLGFNRPKSGTPERDAAAAPEAAPPGRHRRRSRFFVKLRSGDVPIVSLFTRDRTSRSAKLHPDDSARPAPAAGEKRASKDALQRYLSKIKPLYVRVSRRYGEKLGLSGQLSSVDEAPPAPERPSGRSRRLGKSRSAAAAADRSPPAVRRRDDSLLELQDGIQSAIAHCKRSFNAGSESPLLRSRSDPGDARASDPNPRSGFRVERKDPATA